MIQLKRVYDKATAGGKNLYGQEHESSRKATGTFRCNPSPGFRWEVRYSGSI
jgi:hypothetical protein